MQTASGIVSDSAAKANALADFFDAVWDENTVVPMTPEQITFNEHELCIEEDEACRLLRQVNPKKATGSDGIPNVLLKKCAFVLAPSL